MSSSLPVAPSLEQLRRQAKDPSAPTRPGSGFPPWQPSSGKQEIFNEALTWAARNGRVSSMSTLARRGADLDADTYRGTALAWAAVNDRQDAAEWLTGNGADVNRRGTFGGPRHGQGITALHLAAQCGHERMVRLVLEHGADTSVQDDINHANALGWARHFSRHNVAGLLTEEEL